MGGFERSTIPPPRISKKLFLGGSFTARQQCCLLRILRSGTVREIPCDLGFQRSTIPSLSHVLPDSNAVSSEHNFDFTFWNSARISKIYDHLLPDSNAVSSEYYFNVFTFWNSKRNSIRFGVSTIYDPIPEPRTARQQCCLLRT